LHVPTPPALKSTAVADSLKDKDWPKLAKGYNGPAFPENSCDPRLEHAYKKFAAPATR
jgi:hypothetical protein